MKILVYLSVVAAGLAGEMNCLAAPPASATNTPAWQREVPRSAFVIPTSPKEGCHDPFFPNSDRLFINQAPKTVTPQPTQETPLLLNGVSGSSTHRLAIINDRTFAVGEEAEVHALTGQVRIKCVAIKVDNATGAVEVTIEVNGHQQVLRPRGAF